jgi:hypothetical protein
MGCREVHRPVTGQKEQVVVMALYKYCKEHGLYEVTGLPHNACPKCEPVTIKKSEKYGGTSIIIPPNMRSVK